ncbi:MAG TPA: hypothetical protein VD908_21660 [Cytophagales bacterium]|nr:hypothetical protein [Cytophagales bacterium]
MKRHTLLIVLLFIISNNPFLLGQSTPPINILFPSEIDWNTVEEGQKVEFQLQATGGTDTSYTFRLIRGKTEEMHFDSLGYFSWTPGFKSVDRLETNKKFQLNFEVRNTSNESSTKSIELTVLHVNQPPIVSDLKPFYIQFNVINTYKIDPEAIKDEDKDPLVFISIPGQMPEGARLSEQGELTWKPSITQFKQLRQHPIFIEFYVEDQPSKARTTGKLKIEASQMDLPPLITIIPEAKNIRYAEDATINLKFYLSDPNGDEDIFSFSFLSENPEVPKSALVKNTSTQYEFIWEPGYYFVNDPFDSVSFDIIFFVIDKSQKRNEKRINMTIYNAVNEELKDHTLYIQYRTSLVRAWDLLEQLKEKEKELKKDYNRAKKGKKRRALTNASLGAVTGVIPVINSIPNTTQRAVSTVGGTTVLTIGTLEATEVIGKSTKDLVERLNYVMEKKNEIQTKGDIFARKYSLKSLRRRAGFISDMEDFLATLNLKGLVALELNAGWQNKHKASDSSLSKTFKDFVPEGSQKN